MADFRTTEPAINAVPILIVGTGALAILFAARLAAVGQPVTLLGGWEAGLDALRREGVRLVDADGHERRYPIHATHDSQACRGTRYALVLRKAWQTAQTAEQLAACLAHDGLALTLQNGLGNAETLAARLGPERVAVGTTTTGATLLGPGLARAGGEGVISLQQHPRLLVLEALLRRAGFNVRVVDDAARLLWGKLVINAAINPLTALLRVPNGALLERPDARLLMKALARETAAVARALGVTLLFDDPAAAAEDVARKTAANHSSMVQDMLRGAPTEIDAICGAVVQAAATCGMSAPLNEVLWRLVRAAQIEQPGQPGFHGKIPKV